MVARWATIWEGGLKPPFFEAWTEVDKAKLEELKTMDIDMSQTVVGRLKKLKMREAFISVREMNEEEREKIRRSLDKIEAEATEKKRASKVTKYLSTYARVEIIAKLRKKM